MESPSGRLDQNFKNLLKEIAKKSSEQSINIKESILYNYYLKRISCVFQKSLSSSFLSRTGQVNGKLSMGAATIITFISTRSYQIFINSIRIYDCLI